MDNYVKQYLIRISLDFNSKLVLNEQSELIQQISTLIQKTSQYSVQLIRKQKQLQLTQQYSEIDPQIIGMKVIKVDLQKNKWEIIDEKSIFERSKILYEHQVSSLLKKQEKDQLTKLFRFEITNQDDINQLIVILNSFTYSIKQLSLSFNKPSVLNEQSCRDMANALNNHKELTSLEIDTDGFSSKCIVFVCVLVGLKHNLVKTLTTLSISFDSTMDELKEYPKVMKCLPQFINLKNLSLRFSQFFFMQNEPNEIQNKLSKCLNLEQLTLFFGKTNMISNENEREIAISLLPCKKLFSFIIDQEGYNDFNGYETAKILKNSNINTLSLSSFDQRGDPPFRIRSHRYIARQIKRLVILQN